MKVDSFADFDVEYVKIGDGLKIPIKYFRSEEELLDFLLDRAIKKNRIKKMLEATNAIRIREVIFSGPATIVFWRDGEKTVVKCTKNDTMNPEMGIAMCTLKKLLGDSYLSFKKHMKELTASEEKKED